MHEHHKEKGMSNKEPGCSRHVVTIKSTIPRLRLVRSPVIVFVSPLIHPLFPSAFYSCNLDYFFYLSPT
jgi:hypothetical protein